MAYRKDDDFVMVTLISLLMIFAGLLTVVGLK